MSTYYNIIFIRIQILQKLRYSTEIDRMQMNNNHRQSIILYIHERYYSPVSNDNHIRQTK